MLGRPSLAGVALAVAAMAAFFAHEPLLVVLGQRGRRARVEDGPRAMRRLGVLGVLAVALGGLGLALAPPVARMSALPPLVLALVVVWFVWRKEEKSAAGEAFAAAALSGAGMPVALAGGATVAAAGFSWLAFTLAFVIATFGVRAVIARAKNHGDAPRWAALAVIFSTVVGLCGLTATHIVPLAVPASVAPFVVFGLCLSLVPVHARHLRRVGWGLVATSMLTLAVVVAAFR